MDYFSHTPLMASDGEHLAELRLMSQLVILPHAWFVVHAFILKKIRQIWKVYFCYFKPDTMENISECEERFGCMSFLKSHNVSSLSKYQITSSLEDRRARSKMAREKKIANRIFQL